jgi:hypothetical protein
VWQFDARKLDQTEKDGRLPGPKVVKVLKFA